MRQAQPSSPASAPGIPSLQCVVCGYDIHTNPEGNCPECGTTWTAREHIRQGRDASQARRLLALSWVFGIVVLVPWALILALLVAAMLIDWMS